MEIFENGEMVIHGTVWARSDDGILFTVKDRVIQKENGWSLPVPWEVRSLYFFYDTLKAVGWHAIYTIDMEKGILLDEVHVPDVVYISKHGWRVTTFPQTNGGDQLHVRRNTDQWFGDIYGIGSHIQHVDIHASTAAVACRNGDFYLVDLIQKTQVHIKNVTLYHYFVSVLISHRYPHLVLGRDIQNHLFVIDTRRQRVRSLTRVVPIQEVCLSKNSLHVYVLSTTHDLLSISFCPTEMAKVRSLCMGQRYHRIFSIVLDRLIGGDDFI